MRFGRARIEALVVALVLIVVLSCAVGGMVFGGLGELSPARQERLRVETAQWEQEQALTRPARVVWEWGWRVVVVVIGGMVLLGAVLMVVLLGVRRTVTIRPDERGLFPALLGRADGAWVIFDPNRQLSAATSVGGEARVRHHLTPGTEWGQLQVTSQAQAVQALAARFQHAPVEREILGIGDAGAGLGRVEETTGGGGAEVVWPGRVPLLDLLNGGASLGRLALGVTVDEAGRRDVVWGNMARLVHVAVGGSAGWGKSVFLQALVYQLVTAREAVELAMIDLDGTTLAPFASSERLLYPLAENEEQALGVCQALAGELERRRDLFGEVRGAFDLDSYNARVGEPLAPLVLVCDEATALLGDKTVERELRTLALRGRKFGLWTVLSGQDWKSSSLDSAIKNQLSTTVQFRARSPAQSRVLLNVSGAETLPVPGRALAALPGRDIIEMQSPVVSFRQIVRELEGQGGARGEMPQAQGEETAGALTREQREEIEALHAEGESLSAISQAVFGYRNARRLNQIKEILGIGD